MITRRRYEAQLASDGKWIVWDHVTRSNCTPDGTRSEHLAHVVADDLQRSYETHVCSPLDDARTIKWSDLVDCYKHMNHPSKQSDNDPL